jgi:hypothetical protein
MTSKFLPRILDMRNRKRVRRCKYCGNIMHGMDRVRHHAHSKGVHSGVCSRRECRAASAASKPLQSSSRSGN